MAATTTGTHVFPSDLGWMAITWESDQLSRLTFGHPSAAAAIASLDADGDWITSEPISVPPWIAELAARLQSYAGGNEEQFDDVPLALHDLSPFQNKVVRYCRRISRG